MYRADPSIVKRLRESDPDLGVQWDRDRQRWIVTCREKEVAVVQEPNGDYRPLDGRIVLKFREAAWNYRQNFGAFRRMERERHQGNRAVRQREHDAQRDDFRQFVVEEGHRKVIGVGQKTGRSMYGGWGA